MSSSRAVPDLTARRLFAFFCGQGRLSDRSAPRSAPPKSSLPGGLPQDRERRRVVPWGRERSQVRDEQLDIFQRRLLVLLQVDAEPAGGEAAVAVRLFARDQRSQLERLDEADLADLSRRRLSALASFRWPSQSSRRRSRLISSTATPSSAVRTKSSTRSGSRRRSRSHSRCITHGYRRRR